MKWTWATLWNKSWRKFWNLKKEMWRFFVVLVKMREYSTLNSYSGLTFYIWIRNVKENGTGSPKQKIKSFVDYGCFLWTEGYKPDCFLTRANNTKVKRQKAVLFTDRFKVRCVRCSNHTFRWTWNERTGLVWPRTWCRVANNEEMKYGTRKS